MEMNRHKMREVAMTSLYQHLLLGKDIRECVYENCDSNDIDPFLYTITMDTVAVNTNNRIYVPVRYIANALGASVSWDPATRTATFS